MLLFTILWSNTAYISKWIDRVMCPSTRGTMRHKHSFLLLMVFVGLFVYLFGGLILETLFLYMTQTRLELITTLILSNTHSFAP